jgi:hypothetical protein
MDPMRWSRVLVFVLFALFVAACGGSPAASSGGGDGGDGGDGTEQSQPAAESQGDGGGNGGGDGGNGGSAGDADAAYERLTPPNAEQISKTTAGNLVIGAFTSTDSIDGLTSFYEDAFNDLGLQILTTTEASGGISWFVGTDENASEFGGVISVIPNQDGSEGTTISIQIGATNE